MTTASAATASDSSSEPLQVTFRLAAGPDCYEGCPAFVARWQRFWNEHAHPDAPPVAVMVCDGYYEQLRKKSKAMVRQANRRYQFRELDINQHAGDVQAVNYSHRNTSEGPTRGWMVQTVNPNALPDRIAGLCGTAHQDRWFGGFDDGGVLRGYIRLIRMDTLAIIHSIFRHGENSTGVLNGLLNHVADHAGVDHITYHTMDALPNSGRPAFKRRVGFQEARLTIEGAA